MSNIKMKQDQPSDEASAVTNEQILELLKKQWDELGKLREENQELRDKMDPWYEIRKSRERYDWPRAYSYWIMNWKPIISWKTTTDEQYQDPYTKKWVARQEIEVEFIDWIKINLDIVKFWRDLKRSDKIIPKKITQEWNETFYLFEHNWEDFQIERTFINP